MDALQEQIERNMAEIDVQMAEINYLQSGKLSDFCALKEAQSRLPFSRAYNSGNFIAAIWNDLKSFITMEKTQTLQAYPQSQECPK
jgi:hypothetical protein